AKFLKNHLGVSGESFVLFVTLFRVGELEELDFLKLMLTKDATGIFPGSSGFRAETGGPGGDVAGKLFLGNGFVAMEIVQFDLGRGREPEVRAFQAEQVGGKLGQLAGAGERGAIHKKRRKNFRVAVLAGVHVEEEIRQSAFETRSPAFVDSKTRAGD